MVIITSERVEDLVRDLQGDGQQHGRGQPGRETGAGAESVGDRNGVHRNGTAQRAFNRAVQSERAYGQQGHAGHGRGGYRPPSPDG